MLAAWVDGPTQIKDELVQSQHCQPNNPSVPELSLRQGNGEEGWKVKKEIHYGHFANKGVGSPP